MRILLSFAVLALAGCSSVSPVGDAWAWGPARPQPARVTLAPEEAGTLSNRVAGLALQRNEIRGRISAEPDIWKRQDLYAELHSVGRELSPLQRRLAAAAPAR